jgi:hypothetical protein
MAHTRLPYKSMKPSTMQGKEAVAQFLLIYKRFIIIRAF